MTRQGRCLDATQAPVNILDRLEGLSKVVPPEVMEQALSETGMSGQRSCKLSHRVMLWIVLAMGLLTHLPIRQVFKHVRRMRPNEKTPSRRPLRGASASGCRTRATGLRTRGSSAGDAGNAGCLLQGVPLDGHRRHSNGCAGLAGQ